MGNGSQPVSAPAWQMWGECLPPPSTPGNGAGAGGHRRASARVAPYDPAHPLLGHHSCTERVRALLPVAHTHPRQNLQCVGSKSHPPSSQNRPVGFVPPPPHLRLGMWDPTPTNWMGWDGVGARGCPDGGRWVLSAGLGRGILGMEWVGGGVGGDTAGWCQGAGGFLGLAGRGRGNEAASARRLVDPSGTGRSRQSGAGDTARAKDFL